MLRIIVFIGLLSLASIWLAPFTQTILQAKGSFIHFFTSYGIPIGPLGFTAIFTLIGFSIIFGFTKFFIH